MTADKVTLTTVKLSSILIRLNEFPPSCIPALETVTGNPSLLLGMFDLVEEKQENRSMNCVFF